MPAVEVLVKTARVFDTIVDRSDADELERIIAEGEYYGMQTFDQSLLSLYQTARWACARPWSVAKQPEELRIALQQAGMSSDF